MRASQIRLVEPKLIPSHPIFEVQEVNVFKWRKVTTLHTEHSAQKLNLLSDLLILYSYAQIKGGKTSKMDNFKVV